MSVPTVSLQVAFGHGPLDLTPVWTEIAGDLRSLSTTMGRQHQLDRVQPATLAALLDDRLGNYSPWDTSSPYYNLLTAIDSSLPTIGSWVASAGTVGLQSTQTLQGTSAGKLTSTGGTATAHTATGTSGYAVTGSTQYSAGGYFRANTTAQNVSVGINWYTSSGTLIGSTVFGTAVADVNTGWTQATVVATSPSNAAFAAVVVSAASSGTLVHFFDCVMFCANFAAVPIGWTLGQTLPMVPGHPVRSVDTWTAVPYPVYYGFTDSWTPQPHDELNQDVALAASDVLKILNSKYLSNPTVLPNTILASSPLAYWRMGDLTGSSSFADSSGNGRSAYIAGHVGFGAVGTVLYDPAAATDFSDGANAPSGLAFLPNITAASTSSFTFIDTIKTTVNNQIVMQFQSAITGGQLFVEALCIGADGHINLSNGSQPSAVLNNPVVDVEGPLVTDGFPHWIAVTVSQSGGSATWSLSVDGVSYGSGASGPFTWSGTSMLGGVFAVSAGATNIFSTFEGVMQDAAVFTGVLSGAAITNIFTVGSYFQNIEYTGQRIAKALIVAGFGGFPQNLATGTVLCAAEVSPVTQNLCGDYILAANDTENGLLYQDPTGVLQLKDRHYPQINSTTVTSQATIGDNDSATYHYEVEGLSIVQDFLDLYPDIKAQRNNGVIQEVTDFSGVPNGFSQTLQRTALLNESDPDVLILAQWLSYLYSHPLIRVAGVTLSSVTASGVNLPQMLGRQLWDAVTIQRQGSGESPLSTTQVVESISHSFTADDPSWKTTWQLSPFEISAKANLALILNSSSLGILNTNVVGG